MSSSDSTSINPHHHPHGSWYPPNHPPHRYPPEAPSHRYPPDVPPQHAPIHSKHNFYNSTGGNRAPPNQYPHYLPNHFTYGHHPVPYPHHRYPYPYEGSDEAIEEPISSSEQPTNRRDSFPYYHNFPPPQQATPLQPPANAYNGPPVSALVPRFPRGSTMMYSAQGYTPNHRHFDTSHVNSINPPSTGGGLDSGAKGTMYSKDRRTSFGFPMISSNPHYLIPTPQQQTPPGDSNDTSSETSSPVIPVPPIKEEDGDITSNRSRDRNHQPSEFMNQETRCLNLLSKRFESSKASSQWTASVTNMEIVGDLPKKTPSVQDASLLLGLSSDASNNSSPATVPTLKDEAESVTAKTKPQEDLPKTCFPVPIPKKYPRRLSLPNDTIKLNALHCFVRSELLEIFVVEPSPDALKYKHAPSASVGRVGFRCVHCFLARRNTMNASRDDEAPMSVFYPKTVSEIYRLVTSWQRCHVRKCKSLPKDVRDKWHSLRETEKSRGKTVYWMESAKIIGLVDCPSRTGGIRFDITKADQEAVDNLLGIKVEFDGKNLDENSEPSTTSAATKEKSRALNGGMAISTPLAASAKADNKMFQ
jgi:hypothetical protein